MEEYYGVDGERERERDVKLEWGTPSYRSR
jgi:hypothetical protein